MEFSTRSMHNLIISNGDKRVSKPASKELGKVLKRFAGDVAEEAIAVSREEGYKTVNAERVRKALNR